MSLGLTGSSTEEPSVPRYPDDFTSRLGRPDPYRHSAVRSALGAMSVGLLLATTKTSASSHSVNGCGDERPTWANQIRYDTDPAMGAQGTNAAHNTAAAWDFLTEVDLELVSTNTELLMTVGTIEDQSVAGFSDITVDTNCVIVGAKAALNDEHWAGRPEYQTLDEKECIFAHEIGHTVGLAHSNQASAHDSADPPHAQANTIMRGGEHPTRCHVSNPPAAPRAADGNDIATYY